MTSNEDLLAEYNMLREEIKSNSQLISQIFTVTITVAGLLIGYGIQSQNWIVFFSPYAILLPSLWYISSQLESTIRIATYIKTFIEPKTEDLRWESRLFQLRSGALKPDHKYTLSITGIYGAIGFSSLLLAWIFMTDFSWVNIIINTISSIIVGGILLVVILDVRNCFGIKCFNEYCEAWEKSNKKLK